MSQNAKDLQQTLNRFTGKYLRGVTPLIVDGVKGHATNVRIKTVKHYIGYGQKRDLHTPALFIRRVRHPHSTKYSSVHMLATAAGRRTKQRARWAQQHAASHVTSGVTRYDGVPVAAWMVPYLQWARKNGWQGKLVSGYRTPEYSDSLCRRMCGAPQCPGLCAGRASNHSGNVKPRGALDVSDYIRFGQVIARCPYSPRIYNALPRDRVHFSASGR